LLQFILHALLLSYTLGYVLLFLRGACAAKHCCHVLLLLTIAIVPGSSSNILLLLLLVKPTVIDVFTRLLLLQLLQRLLLRTATPCNLCNTTLLLLLFLQHKLTQVQQQWKCHMPLHLSPTPSHMHGALQL
jgi:hypothetical protein